MLFVTLTLINVVAVAQVAQAAKTKSAAPNVANPWARCHPPARARRDEIRGAGAGADAALAGACPGVEATGEDDAGEAAGCGGVGSRPGGMACVGCGGGSAAVSPAAGADAALGVCGATAGGVEGASAGGVCPTCPGTGMVSNESFMMACTFLLCRRYRSTASKMSG